MHQQSLIVFVVHAALEPNIGCDPSKLVERLKQRATPFRSNEPFLEDVANAHHYWWALVDLERDMLS